MKKIRITLVLMLLLVLTLVGCGDGGEIINPPLCLHEHVSWVWDEDAKCGKTNMMYCYCDDCGIMVDQKEELKEHKFVTSTVEATCTERGYTQTTCENCNYNKKEYVDALGHDYIEIIDKEAKTNEYGIKHTECSRCHDKSEEVIFVNNDFASHGALSVKGTDLVDENGEKFRLAGVSSFGLQWQPEYINETTLSNLKNSFGINVIRLSMYTAENGYCTGGEKQKQIMYDRVVNGINIATKLNLYVIVDWHMLGADDNCIEDENPLYFKEEAKEFFDRITLQFSDHENILFEIMNEPSGSATWADCKKYAEEVIPVIRENMPDAIVLVGNPLWTSDLESVAAKPLKGFTNIMYSFHFYANDNCMTSKISTANKKGLPVFVTEHGGMEASGDGEINYTSLEKWYTILDRYNISFVAWSLSNLHTTSCMFKTGSKDIYSVDDSNLKEWGIYYKKRVRSVMGLPVEE